MTVHGLNHVTIRCRPRDLPALHRFYTDAIGLTPGWRPPFPFDGYWLYPPASRTAAIHIAATHPDEAALAQPAPSGFDHLSLTSEGLTESKAHLQRLGIRFDQVPVPGAEIMQLFLRDPIGTKIELTFVGES